MSIDIKQVEHIAELARLSITDEEKQMFLSQLSGILDYIDKLNEPDTSGVEPTSHVIALANVMRDDALRPSLCLEDALGNAPDRTDRPDKTEKFYRVPKIIQ